LLQPIEKETGSPKGAYKSKTRHQAGFCGSDGWSGGGRVAGKLLLDYVYSGLFIEDQAHRL